MSNTIVICSDGTGNSDTGVPSNVNRLYDLIVQDGPLQVAKYDKGVGNSPRTSGSSAVRARAEQGGRIELQVAHDLEIRWHP